MALILSVETATDVCSVALSDCENILGSASINERNVHSAKLANLIKQIINASGKDFADLDAIAVSKGPGSFTGLRIGVSIGKGLAYGLDIPIIGINTLESIANKALLPYTTAEILWCPVIDARNNEVYYALYDRNLNEFFPANAGLLSKESFVSAGINNRIIYVGPAVDSGTLPALLPSDTEFCYNIKPDAESIAGLAYKKFQYGDFEDVSFFEPFYLKDFIAKNISSRIKNVLHPENKKVNE
jgi:tRNA threonylcarbamoyladenosine biosynthesis protein TsaB